ncbi:MAG: glycerol-3-phosphate dehydrogenase C-terminal domain-containing protein, partial [Thermomicrobium sp.]
RRLGQPVRPVTEHLPLVGREGLDGMMPTIVSLAQQLSVEESVPWLLRAYGTEAYSVLELAAEDERLAAPIVPGLPYLLAEVVYACRNELAQRIGDVLERRTWVLFADRQHGLGALSTVGALMARELGWGPDELVCQMDSYRQRVRALCASEQGIGVSRVAT